MHVGTNEDTHYAFRVGAFECVAISDGSHNYSPGRFFADVPQEQYEAVLRQRNLPTEHITTPYTCLFINTGQHRVMVDIGAPDTMPSAGKLVQNMKAAGISPADIDTLIITHAHPDHVGGNLNEEGSPVCPNASYYIWKSEWEFWSSEAAEAQAPAHHVAIAREKLAPVADRLNLMDSEDEIVPGIRPIAAPGHTPGHIVVTITSGGETLWHIADTVLYPLHLEYPNWVPVYDIIPAQAAATKRRIFDRIAEEKALVFAHHFPPFPNVGHVSKQGEGWLWQPADRA